MPAVWTTKAPSTHQRAAGLRDLLTLRATLEPTYTGRDPFATDRCLTSSNRPDHTTPPGPVASRTTYTGRVTA